ncbi:MAG: tRNA (adenosine(37)-N6)-threonylcarbamoyltransferase complex dimerization subunit type 1 TsaB [Clostridia bacterium]|nr:tRNA (adenosine(37)-N6)-threonylcarbamoyltransferase complex dimerization subunit type 1 TsaB [Clostridia bacterium]
MVHGSFTGLRIGISTVKAFSDVTNIPIIGISSLESLAYNIKKDGLIACMIDAKNDNVYFALYNLENNVYTLIEDSCANSISSIIDILKKYKDEYITFVGDGSVVHKETITQNFENAIFASNEQNIQSSISIALAAFDKFQKGFIQNSNTLSPLYLRKSQAERALDGEK